jgi:4-oxalocrotonate tautomerase
VPLLHVEILEGRSAERKEELIAELTNTVEKVLEVHRETIRVVIVEVPKAHWGIGGVSAEALGR